MWKLILDGLSIWLMIFEDNEAGMIGIAHIVVFALPAFLAGFVLGALLI